MTTINKRANPRNIAPTAEKAILSIDIDQDDNATLVLDIADDDDDSDDEEPDGKGSIAVAFDEQAGTAAITLENGNTYTLSEPPTKQFLYFTSWIETAEPAQRSNSMSVFWLSHAMIASIVDAAGQAIAKPSFDEFLDSLGDSDIARIGAAFTCFPNVMARYTRIFENMVDSQRAAVSQ